MQLILVGESGVGKTSLILRYVDDNFALQHLTSIGVDYKTKYVTVNAKGFEKTAKLQLWDTGTHAHPMHTHIHNIHTYTPITHTWRIRTHSKCTPTTPHALICLQLGRSAFGPWLATTTEMPMVFFCASISQTWTPSLTSEVCHLTWISFPLLLTFFFVVLPPLFPPSFPLLLFLIFFPISLAFFPDSILCCFVVLKFIFSLW